MSNNRRYNLRSRVLGQDEKSVPMEINSDDDEVVIVDRDDGDDDDKVDNGYETDQDSKYDICSLDGCKNIKRPGKEFCNRHSKDYPECEICKEEVKRGVEREIGEAKYSTISNFINHKMLRRCEEHAKRNNNHGRTENKFAKEYGKAYFGSGVNSKLKYCIFSYIHYNDEEKSLTKPYATHGISEMKYSKLFCPNYAKILRDRGVELDTSGEAFPGNHLRDNYKVDEPLVAGFIGDAKGYKDIINFINEKYELYGDDLKLNTGDPENKADNNNNMNDDDGSGDDGDDGDNSDDEDYDDEDGEEEDGEEEDGEEEVPENQPIEID